MPLFRSTAKSPKEVVSELREALQYLAHHQTNEESRKWSKKPRRAGLQRRHEPGDFDSAKTAADECSKLLVSLKDILLAGSEAATAPRGSVAKPPLAETVKQCYESDILLYLVHGSVLEELPSPEARRDVVRIFRYFLERQTDSTVKYIIKHQDLLSNLISNYSSGKAQVVAHSGLMLRACSRYKSLVWIALLLRSDDALQFFDFMQVNQFEVLADAFVTFKELLKHEDLTGKFLEENHDEIFQRLSEVLSSEFYITKHVSLEWIQELLNESSCMREHFYSSSTALKTVMTLLGSDPSVTIRFKALDLLQGFLTVADKERHVGEILLSNRDKMEALVSELLTKFDKDKKYCPEPGRSFLLTTLRDPELRPALSESVTDEDRTDGRESPTTDSHKMHTVEPSPGQPTNSLSEQDQPSVDDLRLPVQQPLLEDEIDNIKSERTIQVDVADRPVEDGESTEQLDGHQCPTEYHPAEQSKDLSGEGGLPPGGSQEREPSADYLEEEDGREEERILPDDHAEEVKSDYSQDLERTESHSLKEEEPPHLHDHPEGDKQLLDHPEGSEPLAEGDGGHCEQSERDCPGEDELLLSGHSEEELLPNLSGDQSLPGRSAKEPSHDEEKMSCDLSEEEDPPLPTPSDQLDVPKDKDNLLGLHNQPKAEITVPVAVPQKEKKQPQSNPFQEEDGESEDTQPLYLANQPETEITVPVQLKGKNPFQEEDGQSPSEEAPFGQLEPEQPIPEWLAIGGGGGLPATDTETSVPSVLEQLEEVLSVEAQPPSDVTTNQLEASPFLTSQDPTVVVGDLVMQPLPEGDASLSLLDEAVTGSPKELALETFTEQPASDRKDDGKQTLPVHPEQQISEPSLSSEEKP